MFVTIPLVNQRFPGTDGCLPALDYAGRQPRI
jgi:hypothetical protein